MREVLILWCDRGHGQSSHSPQYPTQLCFQEWFDGGGWVVGVRSALPCLTLIARELVGVRLSSRLTPYSLSALPLQPLAHPYPRTC